MKSLSWTGMIYKIFILLTGAEVSGNVGLVIHVDFYASYKLIIIHVHKDMQRCLQVKEDKDPF